MFKNYHIITAQNMIDRYKAHLIEGNPKSIYRFELMDNTISHLLIESCLSKPFRANVKLDLVMKIPESAFKTCHSSVAFYIDDARFSLVSLSLSSYCRSNLTASKVAGIRNGSGNCCYICQDPGHLAKMCPQISDNEDMMS